MTKTLLELAREATSGPWAYEPHGDTGEYGVGVLMDENDTIMTGYQEAGVMTIAEVVAVEVNGPNNAAFIAAANPKRIIALCEALEGLLNCPVIADGDINSADWGCPESAAAVARACRALKGE